jgi:hypothetical protein
MTCAVTGIIAAAGVRSEATPRRSADTAAAVLQPRYQRAANQRHADDRYGKCRHRADYH